VRATFFCVGYLADQYPDLVKAELRAGMTVGNHSYNHPEVPPFDQLPPRLLEDEITLGAQSLRRAGANPMLFRPPGGGFSPAVVRAAEQLGFSAETALADGLAITLDVPRPRIELKPRVVA